MDGEWSPGGWDSAAEGVTHLAVAGRDIPWLLRTQTERHPSKVFLVWEPFVGDPRTWTYGQFRDRVRLLAGALHARGVGVGDRVLLHLDNSPEFLFTWFACAELGAIAVSTNTRSVSRDVAYFAKHAGVVAAITSPRFAELVADATGLGQFFVTALDAGEPAEVPAGVEHVAFDDLLTESDVAAIPDRPVDPMADLAIQFTSGTTSRPKAVVWTHANAIWAASVNVAHMRLHHDDVALAFLPLFHTNAQSYSMLSTLWVGGTLVLQPRFSASRFWHVSTTHGVTWTSLVRFCVRAILAGELPARHSYRFWASAARIPEVEERLGIPTFGWWGMTETVSQGITASVDQPGPPMSIGRPSPAYEITVRRPDGSTASPGERGALFIRGVRGVSLFKEYYRDPDATVEAFDHEGWFSTGDIVEIGDGGDLYFRDRAKDMLKVGGENVAASEVEAVILETGWVSECAVVARPDQMLDEVPVAFVIAGPSAPKDLAQRIRLACSVDLADFKVPHEVYVVDELPRSTLEKIAKNELRSRLASVKAGP